MLFFPQLASGSVCQLPAERAMTLRTVANELDGGVRTRLSDPGAGVVRWQLAYHNLSDAEWAAIAELFAATEGRLNSFTFLDPTDNLLLWSEDWARSAWTLDPLLTLRTGIADPFGAEHAIEITNGAQTVQRAMQTISAPGGYQYCFSIYLRGDAPATVQLVQATETQQPARAVAVGPAWKRVSHAARLTSIEESIGFGLELPAGVRVQAFGAQVEAQMAPGPYKKTLDRGGVYSRTRFDSDVLSRETEAPGANSCSLALASSLS